jgi:hypothetical protein
MMTGITLGGVLMLSGAVTAAIGAFLPFLVIYPDLTVSVVDVVRAMIENGRAPTTAEESGPLILVLGIGVALLAALAYVADRVRFRPAWLLAALAAVAAAVGLVLWPGLQVARSPDEWAGLATIQLVPGDGLASLGWGFWTCVAGVAVLLVSAMAFASSDKPRAPITTAGTPVSLRAAGLTPAGTPATGVADSSAAFPGAALPAAAVAGLPAPVSPGPQPAVKLAPVPAASPSPTAPAATPAGYDLPAPPVDYLYLDADTPEALLEQLQVAEAEWRMRKGFVVVEAVWEPAARPTVRCALGVPTTRYRRMWPDRQLVHRPAARPPAPTQVVSVRPSRG